MMMMIQLKLYDERYRNIATTQREVRDCRLISILFVSFSLHPVAVACWHFVSLFSLFWHNGKRIFKLSLAWRAVASEEKVYDGRQCRVEYHREAKKKGGEWNHQIFLRSFRILFFFSLPAIVVVVDEKECIDIQMGEQQSESERSWNVCAEATRVRYRKHSHPPYHCIMLGLLALTFSHPTPNRKRARAPIDL